MARTHERIGLVREIVLESSAGKRPSRISDMSMGGCYIESITSFRVGDEITFDLENTAGDALPFSGSVAYVLEGFGFGLSFTNMTPAHMAFLTRALSTIQQPVSDGEADILQLF